MIGKSLTGYWIFFWEALTSKEQRRMRLRLLRLCNTVLHTVKIFKVDGFGSGEGQCSHGSTPESAAL